MTQVYRQRLYTHRLFVRLPAGEVLGVFVQVDGHPRGDAGHEHAAPVLDVLVSTVEENTFEIWDADVEPRLCCCVSWVHLTDSMQVQVRVQELVEVNPTPKDRRKQQGF